MCALCSAIVATRGFFSVVSLLKLLYIQNLVGHLSDQSRCSKAFCLYELYLEIPARFYKGKDFKNLKLYRMEKGRNWGCFCSVLLVYLLPSYLNVTSYICICVYVCMYVYVYIHTHIYVEV